MARNLNYRNARLAAISFAVAGVMVGASFAAVPLYRAFCQATGFAGTPKIAESAPEKMLERKIVVRFNADVDKSLAWKFAAVEDSIELRVGETRLAFYRAENLSGRAITGTATQTTPDMNSWLSRAKSRRRISITSAASWSLSVIVFSV